MESVSEQTYVGLDVHRKSVTATAFDATGSRVSQEKFGASDAELIDYLDRLPGVKHVVLEACTLWEHFYDAAATTGASVVLSNPFKTRLIAEASLKSDKLDSEALATLLRLNSVPQSFAPPPEVRAQRNIVRERVFYRRKAASIKNHIYSVLLRRGIEYEDQVLNRPRKRELLRDLHLEEVDRGLDALTSLDTTCKRLDQEIHIAWSGSEEAQRLSTIPGVGEIISLALAAFLCPIERFTSVDKLSSYVGLAPTTHQSGESEYHGHLKRDSVALLRWLLIEAAWHHRHRVPRGTVAKVSRRVSRRRGKGKGSVAGAHALLKIIFAMLKNREAFRTHAPRPTTAEPTLRHPRVTAGKRVQRAVLGPSIAKSLPAP
ncbi:MAG: IS110 family transposase [Thermoplasmata archaeon]